MTAEHVDDAEDGDFCGYMASWEGEERDLHGAQVVRR
jgi:hypothetical protein